MVYKQKQNLYICKPKQLSSNYIMEEEFSKRLKSARVMQGLSMDALCVRMDNIISKQSISKYETGKMMPDSTVLIALANALQVSVNYLFYPFKTDLQSVEFRKKSKLKITALDSIKEKIRDSVERYLEIESILKMDSQFKINFSNVTVQGADDVKNLVVCLRKEWKASVLLNAPIQELKLSLSLV